MPAVTSSGVLAGIGVKALPVAQRVDTSLDPNITIGARMAPGNKDILDYYLFPSFDVLADHCRLARTNGFVLDVYHAPDLTPLRNLARPTLLPEAA